MDSLPDHILTRIFYFTCESPQFLLLNFSFVCKSFRSAIFRPQLWRNLNLVVAANPEQLESLRSFLQSTADGNIADWIKRLSLAVKRSDGGYLEPVAIESFLVPMANLEALKIEWDVMPLERSTLLQLIKLCPSVSAVELGMFTQLDDLLTLMAKGWPRLNVVVTRENCGFRDDDFDEFSRICQPLSVFCHDEPHGSTTRIQASLMKKFLEKHGGTLKSMCPVEYRLLPQVVTFAPRIEELSIKRTYMYDNIGSITAFRNLKYLQFSDYVSDADLISLLQSGNLCNLKALVVCERFVEPAVVECIAEQCPNLQALDLGWWSCMSDDSFDIIFSRFKNLVALGISFKCDDGPISSDFLALIPSLSLTKLQLLNCYKIDVHIRPTMTLWKFQMAIEAMVKRTEGLKVVFSGGTVFTQVNDKVVKRRQIDGHWIDQLKMKLNWPPMTVGHFLSQGRNSSFLPSH